MRVSSVVAATAVLAPLASARMVYPWMCLERCGDNTTDIAAQLQQFVVNASVFTDAAFEDFNLGPNSTLVTNNLTQVSATLHSVGVRTWAMVSSYPYPPEFLYWMRQVFADPQPFIDECVRMAAKQRLSGFNIDWEPVTGSGAPTPTPQDTADYAKFLDTFSKAMHKAGLMASVDVATWSPIWNLTAIAATDIDYIMNMATYTDNWTSWQKAFQLSLQTIPKQKLVIGLETVHDSDGKPYTSAELQLRFDALKAAGVNQIGIWRTGIPDNWWPFLKAL